MKNLLGRPPKWLMDFLKLTEPKVPDQLSLDEIVPVIDVGQEGWLRPEDGSNSLVLQPASTAARVRALFITENEGPEGDAGLIACMSVTHNGGAAPGSVGIYITLFGGIGTPPPTRILISPLVSIAVGATAPWTSFKPDGGLLFMPPSQGFAVDLPATGVGETYDAVISAWRLRPGCKWY